MIYLAQALVWYIVAAFLIGLLVGWITCSRRDNG